MRTPCTPPENPPLHRSNKVPVSRPPFGTFSSVQRMYLNIEKHESCNKAARVYEHVAHTSEEVYGINVAFEDSPRVLPTVGGGGRGSPALISAARHSRIKQLFRPAIKPDVCFPNIATLPQYETSGLTVKSFSKTRIE